MPTPPGEEASEGLKAVAHAIRRSTALHVAMSITGEGSSVDDLLATADRLARWVNGKAVEADAAREPEKPLGKPWPS